MTQSQTNAMLFGALVSDAACLGVHWIYDPERIAEIAARQGGESAFAPVDAAHFEGIKGYFAHGGRHNGMLTQYGEVLWLAIQSMNANAGDFDVTAYQTAFTGHFGPGGSYNGYIDRPTRAALSNIATETNPSGIDDDQNPAVARLPAIFARYQGRADLKTQIKAAMEVTNVNDVALAYNMAFADVLTRVHDGEALTDALEAAVKDADPVIQAELSDALTTGEPDSTQYAGKVGRACHLPTSGPVCFHILKRSGSYREAVERNALAGGDNAGRAIMIGAIMGLVHGVGSETGVPLDWALQMQNGAEIWAGCDALKAAG